MHSILFFVLCVDIKPANIFVYGLDEETNGLYERWKRVKIKLGDFGFSKDITDGLDMTCRSVLGSPLYMSPERMLHRKYYFDSEIWSMACVVYEVLLVFKIYLIILSFTKSVKTVRCSADAQILKKYSWETHLSKN